MDQLFSCLLWLDGGGTEINHRSCGWQRSSLNAGVPTFLRCLGGVRSALAFRRRVAVAPGVFAGETFGGAWVTRSLGASDFRCRHTDGDIVGVGHRGLTITFQLRGLPILIGLILSFGLWETFA